MANERRGREGKNVSERDVKCVERRTKALKIYYACIQCVLL